MKDKDYIHYSFEQLLQDEFFLESHFRPTPESTRFWEEMKDCNTALKAEIECAETLLKNMPPYRKGSLSDESKQLVWQQIKATNLKNKEKQKRKHLLFYFSTSAAACIAILCVIGWLYGNLLPDNHLSEIEKVPSPSIQAENISLILGNNKELTLKGDSSSLHYDKTGGLVVNSKKLKLQDTEEPARKETAYNQLVVPAGKRSFLALSDGTKIWVNANTRVVYPVVFEKKKREIYVDGEIYLEVFHNEKVPFVVKTSKLDVNVLGTSFNVSAYNNEPSVSVVLVTGKVNVKTKDRLKAELRPKQMYNYAQGKGETKEVDVDFYIAWKDGLYRFDNEKFSVVLDKLAKYYGKEIEYPDNVTRFLCSGTLDLRDDMITVLKGLESTVPVIFDFQSEKIKVNVKP